MLKLSVCYQHSETLEAITPSVPTLALASSIDMQLLWQPRSSPLSIRHDDHPTTTSL